MKYTMHIYVFAEIVPLRVAVGQIAIGSRTDYLFISAMHLTYQLV
jgi:hypothetical protein